MLGFNFEVRHIQPVGMPNRSLQRTPTRVDHIADRRPSAVGNVSAASGPLAQNVGSAELGR